MEKFLFWQRWLYVVGIVISLLGVIMVLLSGTALFDMFNRHINPVFWGSNIVEEPAKGFQQWIYGVLGATMAGWGVFMTFIARYPFRNKEKWAWNCMSIGMLLWFFLDTSLSIFHKVYFNAVFNAALMIIVMLPVVFTKKHFAQ
jgi:drug/metabolite transporter (DMT)-like permease